MVAGALIAGKYRLVRPLAAGGMGSVWVARHLELDVEVALKLIADADPSSAARARFRREAKAAAQLTSPYVVRIFDYGTEGDAPYIAMERLSGEDLKSRLERVGSIALAEVSAITAQIAKALDEAHAAGLVHRDVKPRNVFLARAGDEEIVKVLDFGIAKDLTAREETQTGVLLGSPHYMSPEQARGGMVDARSDVWSLGVVAFEMLSCEKPFPGTALGDVIARICTEPPRRLSEVAPELPGALDDVFARALARDPAARYEGVRAFAAALAAVAEDHPGAHAPRIVAAAAPPEPSFGRTGTTAAEGRTRLTALARNDATAGPATAGPATAGSATAGSATAGSATAGSATAGSGAAGSDADAGTLATLTTSTAPRRRATRFGLVGAAVLVALGGLVAFDRVASDGSGFGRLGSASGDRDVAASDGAPPSASALAPAALDPRSAGGGYEVAPPSRGDGAAQPSTSATSSAGATDAAKPPPPAVRAPSRQAPAPPPAADPPEPANRAAPEVIRDDLFGVPIGVEP